MIGGHLIKSWSSTQPSITMSSGEAEMVGVTRAAAAALGFRSLMADLGLDWPMRVWTDSTASIGMCSRQGLGKVRHLAVQTMWIQQRVRNHDIDPYKVLGEENPADLMTKAGIPHDRITHLIRLMGCEFQSGRPASAPTLRTEGGMKAFSVSLEKGARCSLGNVRGPNARATSGDEAQVLLTKWRDAETGDSMSALDIEHMAMKVLGLPHQTFELALQYQMVPSDPPPEASEPVDVLIEHGQAMGSAGEGRAPLTGAASITPIEGGRTVPVFNAGVPDVCVNAFSSTSVFKQRGHTAAK